MSSMKKWKATLLAAACLMLPIGAQAETAYVTRGSLSKTVFGAGAIQPQSQPGIYTEMDAMVLESCVGMGDEVKAGDILMRLQNDDLEDEIAQLEYETLSAQETVLYTKTHTQYAYKQARDDNGELRFDVNTGEPLMEKYSNEITIRAPCDGRIMAIYIQPGDDTLAVYREYGCVAMLSTDGRMKVELQDVESGLLAYDQQVRVVGDGIDTTGSVVSLVRRGTQAVIQVNSDLFPMDTPVTVETLDGHVVGQGILEINKPMAISAYGGTVKGLPQYVQVGRMVERYDVFARINWDEIPLYYDNDKVQYAYVKAKVQLEKAMEKREKLTLTAPCDGKVISVEVKEGESVAAGTRVMQLVESGAGMTLILAVDELDIPWVVPGQRAILSVDALADVTLSGTVQKIAPLGNTESGVTTYDVYIALEGDVDERVLGGMNVTGEILVSAREDALLLPVEALSRDGEGWTVQTANGDTRSVEIGMMTDSQAQILSGLSEGEAVAY